jgi:thiol-disulfide isomerase/thioredoxin
MKKVIMFSAQWCSPCQRTKPTFNSLKESTNDVEYQLVDVDEQSWLAEKFDVRAVPTFVLLKDEKEVARMSGGAALEKLKTFINQ